MADDTSVNDEVSSVLEYDEDVKDAAPPVPLPVKKYHATISGAKPKLSKNNSKYAEVAFFIEPDAYPVDYTDGDPNGTTIYYRRVSLENSPKARYQLRKFLETIHGPMGRRIDLNDWIGLGAVVEVTHEAYEGVNNHVITRIHEAT